jgi:hypothetical protein
VSFSQLLMSKTYTSRMQDVGAAWSKQKQLLPAKASG